MHDGDDERRELALIGDLADGVRAQLYGVREGGWRAQATTAVAASCAEEAYQLTDLLPDWQNETSARWRVNLMHVWAFLEGDASRHATLSGAIAEFLTSPLNHVDGQDGPDDFDRPQTVAAYSAALSVVAWGVDFALTAMGQIFDAVDLKHESLEVSDPESRWADVEHEADFVRRVVATVVRSTGGSTLGLTPEVVASLRS